MLSVAYANLATFKEARPFSLALELFERVLEHIHEASEDPCPDLISAHNNMANIARVKGHENNVVELYLKVRSKCVLFVLERVHFCDSRRLGLRTSTIMQTRCKWHWCS